MTDDIQKAYLGDFVYVEYDAFGYILTTNNGYGPSATIVLSASVYLALRKFVERTSGVPND